MGTFLLRIGEWLGEAKFGLFNAATAFIALHYLFQTLTLPVVSHFAGTGVSIDDAEQLIYLPHFWMGYGGSQPPLYGWLNTLGAQVFGTTILSLKIVKYLVLFLAVVCVAASVRKLGYPRRTAAAATLGLFTIPQILWESQHALTNSIAALAFSAMMVLALVLLFEKQTALRYIFFGVSAGLAILGKYNDALFLAALLAASLSVPVYRPAILNRWLVLSAGMAILVLLPSAIWSLEHSHSLLGHAHKFKIDRSSGNSLQIWLTGIWDFLVAIFDFAILPVALIVIAFAVERLEPLAWLRAAKPAEQFIGRSLLFSLIITLFLIVVSGTTGVRDRWLIPLLFLLPAYAAMRAEIL